MFHTADTVRHLQGLADFVDGGAVTSSLALLFTTILGTDPFTFKEPTRLDPFKKERRRDALF